MDKTLYNMVILKKMHILYLALHSSYQLLELCHYVFQLFSCTDAYFGSVCEC